MRSRALRRLAALVLTVPLAAAACAGNLLVSIDAGMSFDLPAADPAREEAAGSYRYDLRIDPPRPRALSPLVFTVTITPADGRPFPPPEEALARFYLVRGDLEEFHGVESPKLVSAEEGGAAYSFSITLAKGGDHGLVIGFLDRGRLVSHCIRIPVEGPPQGKTRWDYSRVRQAGGVRAVLRSTDSDLRPREPLDFSIQLGENGLPVAGLEPIAGGLAGILVMRRGPNSPALLSAADAPRPLVVGVGGGSRIHFRHTFPTDDKYRIFVRYSLRGMARTLVYDVWVEEPPARRLMGFGGGD